MITGVTKARVRLLTAKGYMPTHIAEILGESRQAIIDCIKSSNYPVHQESCDINFEVPTFLNVSGGRTSGYMAYLYKDNPKVTFLFQNTGREREETYTFLHKMEEDWGINIHWLEYDNGGVKRVTYETANRTGKPFEQIINKRKAVPNKTWRFCTQELKIKTARRYIRSLGHTEWNNLLGYRFDEPHRLFDLQKRAKGKNVIEHCYTPLYDEKITSKEIGEFWKGWTFDLELPLLPNGKTFGGNCMGCFWHSEYQNATLCKTHPEAVDWLIEQEKRIGATFMKEISWEEMREFAFKVDASSLSDEEMYCMEPGGSCGV